MYALFNFRPSLTLSEFGWFEIFAKWRHLYKKAEDLSETFDEHRGLADNIAADCYLNDKEWGRKLYEKALDLAKTPADFKEFLSILRSLSA